MQTWDLSLNNTLSIRLVTSIFTIVLMLSIGASNEATAQLEVEIEDIRKFGRLELGQGENRDILFLTVGSEHYASGNSGSVADISSFARIPGVNRSANRIANLLLEGGAKYGVTITSRRGEFVTQYDIAQALKELNEKSLEYKDPFLIVYIASHGLASGFSETHFVIPGDLAVDESSLSKVDPIADFYWHALPVAEIGYSMIHGNLPYLMFIDSCRTSKKVPKKHFELMAGADKSDTMLEVAKIAREMGGSIGAPNVIFFSSPPGQDATTVPDPFDRTGLFSLAPLARRLMLSAHKAREVGRSILLFDLILDMKLNYALDEQTSVAHSNIPFSADSPDELTVFYTGTIVIDEQTRDPKNQTHHKRFGTGRKHRLCCAGVGNAPNKLPEGRREIWLTPEMSVIWGVESK